ncbi:MAG: NFACT family protein, partial [Deferribacterota bacterium]|nr:NFACT family protein [Deferribacterota bacterium]
MDGLTVYKISKILKQNIINYSIKTIGVVNNNVQVVFYKHPIYNSLHILLNPQLVAIYVDNVFNSENNKFKFLNNTCIKDVNCSDFERVIFIDLFKYRSSGRKIMYKLVFEFFSKYPNFYILDEEDKIIYMLNNHYLDKSRKIELGEYYVNVKSNKSKSLRSDNFYDFKKMKGFYSVTALHALELVNNIGFDKAKENIINSLENDYFYIDLDDRLIPFEPIDYKKAITFEELENYYKEKVDKKLLHDQKKKLLSFFDRQE